MRVLHVASEAFPLVKTGGLADVAAALPAALADRGLDVRLVLPGFPDVLAGARDLAPLIRLGPAFGAAVVTVLRGRLPDGGLPLYVLDAPFLYRRPGNPYLAPDGHDWPDNHRRFALLGWAAAHLAAGELDPDWQPDVLHAHDWHAGLVPAYIAANPAMSTPTVFTIHNLAFRGLFPLDAYPDLGLPARKLTPAGLEFHGHVSFMKAGLVFSHRITTVSPRYAREICTPEFGYGLEGVLQERHRLLSGILNGVDYGIWNPAADPLIPDRYDANRMAGKEACKAALQVELGLAARPAAPLVAVISRLTSQKGMDLLLGALPELVGRGGQLALLGSGDGELEAGFRRAAAAHPGAVAVAQGHDEGLAHRILAGADVIAVPSRFEPCGLTQLYGLRYGAVPLVRGVGGLADTVSDAGGPGALVPGGTGFVFEQASVPALGDALRRALDAYAEPEAWRRIQRNGMEKDFSWGEAAGRYESLYEEVLAERR